MPPPGVPGRLHVFDPEEPMPHTIADHADPPDPAADADRWQRVPDALRAAGTDAGADAADGWAQDTPSAGGPAATPPPPPG